MSCDRRQYRSPNHKAEKTAGKFSIHSDASLSGIFENASMMIYSLDRMFRYRYFNRRLKNSIEQVYNVEIKIGDVAFNFLDNDPQEANYWRNIYSQALEGEALEFIKEFKFNDLHLVYKFFINSVKEGKQITGLTCVAIDITREQLAEAQVNKMANDLFKRNQGLEQYAYIVAHNLRGPVANLLGIANLLELPDVSIKDKEEAKSHILRSARHLDGVIKDLNYILLAKEEINQHRESVRFQDLVDDVLESIASAIGNREAVVKTDFTEQTSIVTVKAYLHSIFYNLISNSIKYSKPGIAPFVMISSKLCHGHLRLTFEDNGLGFDLKTCGDKVFGLYKRFHPEVAEGKGIGLFMVRTQVETLGGEISVDSEVGRGTTMTIRL